MAVEVREEGRVRRDEPAENLKVGRRAGKFRESRVRGFRGFEGPRGNGAAGAFLLFLRPDFRVRTFILAPKEESPDMRDAGRIKVDRGLGFCNGQNDRLVLKQFAHGRFEGGFSAPGAVRECSERAFVAERNRKKARGAVVNACCKFGGRKRLIVRRRGEKLRRAASPQRDA